MNINFVMSSFVQSSIFEHLIRYFRQYGKYNIIVTKDAVEDADVYYYFRPHLEQRLHPNSIVTVHHDLEDDDPNLSMEWFLPRYREAAIVVCLNSYQQKLLKVHGIENSVVIPHGYNDKILSPLPKYSTKKKTIGFFSHHYARNVKGEDYFLSLLAKLNPNTMKIVLAGRKRKPLCSMIQSMGYECNLYEALPYCQYNQLYSLIDVLMITSHYEGGPASVPEAIATHTPIVTTKVGMVYDLLDNPNIYLLSGDRDIDALTITDVCFNYKFNNENNMQFKVWKDIVANYEELFLRIVKESRSENKFLIDRVFKIFDVYLKRIKYFYHTFYLKKRLKEKLLELKNVNDLQSIICDLKRSK